MNRAENTVGIRHVSVSLDKTFEETCTKFESRMGRIDYGVFEKMLCDRESETAIRNYIKEIEGPLGLMIFNGSVTLADWNKYWHDHKQEIATGRVQILDLSPEETKKVAELISTTDGIIFRLWSNEEKVPSGHVVIPQSVGHVNLTEAQLKNGAKESVNVSKKSK